MLKSCCQHAGCAPIDGVAPASEGPGLCAEPQGVPQDSAYQGPSVPLTELRTGQSAVVRAIDLDARDSSMLRAMGLRVNARVRICRLGEPCIIELVGGSRASVAATDACPRGSACTCRIGLAKPLARRVMVGVG